jgi:hypothetical protein
MQLKLSAQDARARLSSRDWPVQLQPCREADTELTWSYRNSEVKKV